MANRNFEEVVNDSLDVFNAIDDVEIDEDSLEELMRIQDILDMYRPNITQDDDNMEVIRNIRRSEVDTDDNLLITYNIDMLLPTDEYGDTYVSTSMAPLSGFREVMMRHVNGVEVCIYIFLFPVLLTYLFTYLLACLIS